MSTGEIGDRIRQCAEAKGWSIRELCRRAGLPHRTIHNYVSRGSVPKLDTVADLARVLETSLDYLAHGEGPMFPKTSPQAPTAELSEVLSAIDDPGLRERLVACHRIATSGNTPEYLLAKLDTLLAILDPGIALSADSIK